MQDTNIALKSLICAYLHDDDDDEDSESGLRNQCTRFTQCSMKRRATSAPPTVVDLTSDACRHLLPLMIFMDSCKLRVDQFWASLIDNYLSLDHTEASMECATMLLPLAALDGYDS